MPRNENIRKRAPAGMCVPHKKTKIVNGKEYTYYEVKCTVGYDPVTGKQIQRTITGKTQKEAIQKYKKIQAEVESRTYCSPCKYTVAEWLETWLTVYCKSIKTRTLFSYRENCEVHIIPALGDRKLKDLTYEEVQLFYNGLKNARTGADLSPKTIKNIHGTLHRALERAKSLGYIPRNPADAEHIELPRIEKTEIVPFEEEEISRLIVELENNPYRNVLLVTLFCGFREGESLGLSWDCIDWKNRTIRIKQQLQKNRFTKQYEIISPKGNRARTVSPPDFVFDLLTEQRKLQEKIKKDAGPLWNNPWNLVYTRGDGSNLCPQTVYTNYKRRVKAIGCDDKRIHDLRHTFAVGGLQEGVDIKSIQADLGHFTAAFTVDTYAHITDGMREENRARRNAYVEKVTSNHQNPNAKGENKGEMTSDIEETP